MKSLKPAKGFQKMLAAFGAALLFSCLSLTVAAQSSLPRPTADFFVNDFAGVMNSEDKAEVLKQAKNLYAACKAQVVVTTVKSLEGAALEDYSVRLARQWKLGDSEKNNGVLLLLALKERQVRIEVGSGLEGALNDAKTGRILDNCAVPEFKNDRFSAGLKQTYLAITAEVYKEYGLDANAEYLVEEASSTDIGGYAVAAIVGIVVLASIFGRKRGGPRGPRGFRGAYFPMGSMGDFNSSSRGGGFSGGGFSGGGGGFSGGGSSRGF